MEIKSETLNEDELASITGYSRPSKQICWLIDHGWQYTLTGARRPVVGRIYARLKLSGVKATSTTAVAETWTLDLSRVG
jgi:hypothetical protein